MAEFSWPPMQPITPDGFLTAVYDGDTPYAHIRWNATPEGILHDVPIRVDGINAVELRTIYGLEARAAAVFILAGHPELTGTDTSAYAAADTLDDGTKILRMIAPPHVTFVHQRREKYGRFLARITLSDGGDFSQRMLLMPDGSPRLASDGVTPLAVPYTP